LRSIFVKELAERGSDDPVFEVFRRMLEEWLVFDTAYALRMNTVVVLEMKGRSTLG
jgi:uncharacterized protein YfbU (UPF0304 family)